jgi:hypothetical protein
MHCYKPDTAKWPKNEHFKVSPLFIFRGFLESINQFETPKRNDI